MFDSCCFSRSNKKKVKHVQVFNKQYLKNKSGQKALNGHNSNIQTKLIKNQVLTSVPLKCKNQDMSMFKKGGLKSHPKKTILKSEYDNLIHSYKGSDQKWKDLDFKPCDDSWGYNDRKVIWKRASEAIPNAKFVQNSFSPSDILQGRAIGNCYFLSAVAGIAQKPDRILRIFPNTQLNKNGIYMARILHKGVFQEVIVDDYFPFGEDGKLLSSSPAGGKEIWVMIIEKCWAKMHGSYYATEGGLPEQVLQSISSAPTYHLQTTEQQINDQQFLDTLWDRMLRSQQLGYVMCAGTVANREKQTKKLGLVDGHAYTVLSVHQIPEKIVKLRNPWGRKQWKGRIGDDDRDFWDNIRREIKQQIGYDEDGRQNGTFFMLWQDFLTFFDIIDFCEYEDDANYHYEQEIFQNHVPLYYEIQIQQGKTVFALSQSSVRVRSIKQDIEKIKLNQATLLLAKVDGDDVEYISSLSSNQQSDFCMACQDLKPGKYILVAFMDGLSKKIQATVSIYSTNNITFAQTHAYNYDFINKVFIDHARKNPQKQIINECPQEWICLCFLKESNFFYTVAQLSPKSTSSLQLSFDQAEYNKGPFQLLPDNKGKGKFKQICTKDKQTVVVAKLYLNQLTQAKNSQSFPQPKISRQIR